MTERFQLGQQVTVTDHLFRPRHVNAAQVLAVAEVWPHIPERVLKFAREAMANAEYETRPHSAPGRYKILLPVSLGPWKHNDQWGNLGVDTRRHPVVHDLPMPAQGIITRQGNLSDGIPEGGGGGSHWFWLGRRVGYHVAYHLNRRPLIVLPHMIQEASDD